MAPAALANDVAKIRDAVRLLSNGLFVVSRMYMAGDRQDSLELRLRDGTVLVVPFQNPDWFCQSEILGILREVWIDQVYTPTTMRIENGDHVFDVGANLGVFSVFAGMKTPLGSVTSFEPVPWLAKYARRNSSLNALKNVNVIEKGLWDASGTHDLWIDPKNVGGHSAYQDRHRGTQERIRVEFLTLDDALEHFEPENVDLLKMDAEGAEFAILRSASSQALSRIKNIAMEYHEGPGRDVATLERLLEREGFRVAKRPLRHERGLIWATSMKVTSDNS